jgi:ADP-ribose pyrophosphatase YjhB (NUDIX family)
MSFEEFVEKINKSPFVPCTVDIIIEHSGKIVLIKRKYPPFGWAIPGGFVEKGESLESAAAREAKEETNLDLEDLRQFGAYSDPGRDPRFHTISMVFTARGRGPLKAASDAKEIGLFNMEDLPPLAFDHADIVREYFKKKSGNQA